MQAVLANKLFLHPSVAVALPVPAPTRGRITYPELRALVIYVAMLLRGTHKEGKKMTGGHRDICVYRREDEYVEIKCRTKRMKG